MRLKTATLVILEWRLKRNLDCHWFHEPINKKRLQKPLYLDHHLFLAHPFYEDRGLPLGARTTRNPTSSEASSW
jgi:hypothetical protein